MWETSWVADNAQNYTGLYRTTSRLYRSKTGGAAFCRALKLYFSR